MKNSQENTCAGVSFLIKLQVRPAILLKKRLWHGCFPVNFAKFLRKPLLTEHLQRLLLIPEDETEFYENTYSKTFWKLWEQLTIQTTLRVIFIIEILKSLYNFLPMIIIFFEINEYHQTLCIAKEKIWSLHFLFP